MKIAISGIQPTNRLTLGNYLGAIKHFVNLQDKYKMYIFVADLHSLSVDFDEKTLFENKLNLVLSYIALGLDINKCHLFFQSDVYPHTELNWIFTCLTTMGELSRMTQYKDKTAKLTQQNKTVKLPTGLFMYPVLMAADIALYNSDVVIVGADQKQHVEFARELIERFNKKYRPVFTLPEPVISKTGARIMDLLNPEIKMSKSNTNINGTIFLSDEPNIAADKIMKAKTDSLNIVKYDQDKQLGISNLITIYHCLTDMSIADIEKKYTNTNYGLFKKDLAKIVSDFLVKFQNEYNKQKENKKQIFNILTKHANTCIELTSKKMKEVYGAIGLNKSW